MLTINSISLIYLANETQEAKEFVIKWINGRCNVNTYMQIHTLIVTKFLEVKQCNVENTKKIYLVLVKPYWAESLALEIKL